MKQEAETLAFIGGFRLRYLEPYAEAVRTWLHKEAEVIDTTHLAQAQTASLIATAIQN